jgi:hypothetical protein
VRICQNCGELDWFIFPRKEENLEERIEKLFDEE